MLNDQERLISYESIYRHIWANKQAGGDLYLHLRRQGKKYDKRRNGKSTRGQIKNRVSIDDRPEIVDDKLRIGDWDIDTVIGKGHSGALVTIVERVTNNVKEFSYHEKISQALSAEVYFAHPYSSWERGLNENTNGLLRQCFPKNTDFKKVGR